MLQSHFAAVERSILEMARIQNVAGHSLHKGTPREIFVKNFLANHLGKTVSFGTGEILDVESKPKEPRNQHDIVIYRNEFPMLDFLGGIAAFLAESVVATIEVKSNLTYSGLKTSFLSAITCKNMNRNYFDGLKMWHFPPAIMNFIVAYNGPAKMKTIYQWIKRLEGELPISHHEMPASKEDRIKIPAPGIDGIFILGKGFVHFDNFMIDCVAPDARQRDQWMRWILVDSEVASLLFLFLNLAQAVCSYPQKAIQLLPYLKDMKGDLQWGK
jgi:hypothetical protein